MSCAESLRPKPSLLMSTHKPWIRWVAYAWLTALVSSCGIISRRVDVIPFIPPRSDAKLEQLVARINEMSTLESLTMKVDLQFLTIENEQSGQSRQYRTAQGRLLLDRPANIRLQIEAPVLNAPIADLASDGDRFQLLIYPSRYRALIEGENDQRYEAESEKIRTDEELSQAGPLINIRPQHFTQAFLREPIRSEDRPYLQEDLRIEEEIDPRTRKKRQVKRSYYVVTVVHPGEQSPRTQYWFDRSAEIELRRQHLFDSEGLLVGIVHYSGYLPPHEASGIRFPAEVLIDRPYEKYGLRVRLKPDSIVVDRELPATAFVLEAPPEWEGHLRRVRLGEKPTIDQR